MRSTALRPLVVLAVVLPPAARATVPNSIHELEHKLALQSQQHESMYEKVGHAVATVAIYRGLRKYYQSVSV
jgi:hypothetical protein